MNKGYYDTLERMNTNLFTTLEAAKTFRDSTPYCNHNDWVKRINVPGFGVAYIIERR